jgi:hypothetical protein
LSGGNAFNFEDGVGDQAALAILRKPQGASKHQARAKFERTKKGGGDADVVGSRFQIESRPAKEAMVGREFEKARGEYRTSLGKMKPRLIEHHVMAGALGTQPHAEFAAPSREPFQAQLLKIVQ